MREAVAGAVLELSGKPRPQGPAKVEDEAVPGYPAFGEKYVARGKLIFRVMGHGAGHADANPADDPAVTGGCGIGVNHRQKIAPCPGLISRPHK